ncbi:MAG: hypothetical protein KDA73_08015 [Rhodobacteraceae bacterium]|nr:hypothetical protein [Paracoccaceae bacterium]
MLSRATIFALGLAAAHSTLAQESVALSGAAEIPAAFNDILSSRANDCASFEEGLLTVESGAIVRADLDGDGAEDWILDETHLACSSAASLFCGTGGCNVNFLIGDRLTSRLAKGWEVVDFTPLRVLLVQVHGVRCGGTNLNACVEAMVWDPTEKRYFSIAPEE